MKNELILDFGGVAIGRGGAGRRRGGAGKAAVRAWADAADAEVFDPRFEDVAASRATHERVRDGPGSPLDAGADDGERAEVCAEAREKDAPRARGRAKAHGVGAVVSAGGVAKASYARVVEFDLAPACAGELAAGVVDAVPVDAVGQVRRDREFAEAGADARDAGAADGGEPAVLLAAARGDMPCAETPVGDDLRGAAVAAAPGGGPVANPVSADDLDGLCGAEHDEVPESSVSGNHVFSVWMGWMNEAAPLWRAWPLNHAARRRPEQAGTRPRPPARFRPPNQVGYTAGPLPDSP